MQVAILTSTETRHRYFANAVRKQFPVVAACYEETGYSQAKLEDQGLTSSEQEIIAHHFAERARQEERFFGHDAELPTANECAVLRMQPGTLNSAETLAFLKDQGADTVVVFGTNLIKPPLLETWPGRMINMHLGLSPYYRGTATNFYPLLNEEPEFVGATIHLLTTGIDSGPILKHARPTLAPDDMPHTIGCKAIVAGIEAMIEVLHRLHKQGNAAGIPQWSVTNAKLYLRKDYDPRHVVELYRKIDAGMLRRHLSSSNRPQPERLIV